MIVKYDEDNFSIKLYRDFVKGKLVGLMEVIPIEDLLDVWEKPKTDTPQTEVREVCDKDGNCSECWKELHCRAKDTSQMGCDTCRHYKLACELFSEVCKYEPTTQTESEKEQVGMDICGDNRFEIIAKAKAHLLDATNIDTSEDEMKVIDNFLFRCWQMGWLDRYAEQTEPQTELVNDSPILVKDLVDDEFNPYDEECMRCKHLKLKCEFIPTYCKFEPRDEPQRFTDKDGDVWEWRDNTWKCISNDEPQADYTDNCHKCKRIRECGYPIVGKCKYEPQTGCETCNHNGEYAYCRLCGRPGEDNYEPQMGYPWK